MIQTSVTIQEIKRTDGSVEFRVECTSEGTVETPNEKLLHDVLMYHIKKFTGAVAAGAEESNMPWWKRFFRI